MVGSEDLLGVNVVEAYFGTPRSLETSHLKLWTKPIPTNPKTKFRPLVGSRILYPWTIWPIRNLLTFGEVEEVVPVPPVARVPLVPRAELEGAAPMLGEMLGGAGGGVESCGGSWHANHIQWRDWVLLCLCFLNICRYMCIICIHICEPMNQARVKWCLPVHQNVSATPKWSGRIHDIWKNHSRHNHHYQQQQ